MGTLIDLPQAIAEDVRAVLAAYYEDLRGKIARRKLESAVRGERIKPTVEIDIVRRLNRAIRKRIDASVADGVRARAKVAHLRGCLRTRVAAILGCTPYEAEVWSNLSTPRDRPDAAETEDAADA